MKYYHETDSVELVLSGENYFDVLEGMIDECRECLHLQTYIFQTDETGLRIVEALHRAAARGVKIWVLADAYASRNFSKRVVRKLRAHGVKIRFFAPLFSTESLYFGRRLHHKTVVADRRTGLTGGINIANKYRGEPEQPAWLDYAVLTKGRANEYLHLLCESFYTKKRVKTLRDWERKQLWKPNGDGPLLRFRRNDWLKRKNDIHKTYAEAIINAEHCITLVASYFLPGRIFRKLLQEAAVRGVEIRIILAGRSDSSTVRLAEHYLYDFYLRNKIRSFEWGESVMHGKAMVIDNKWATVGSYNLNFLSHYISIELNADISDARFAQTFTTHLGDIMNNRCKAVEYTQPGKSVTMRVKTWLAFHFYRWLMSVVVVHKRKRNF